MKVLKFVPMMQAQGCKVILYGPDKIDCSPDEHVVITTEADRKRWGFEPGFDTVNAPFLWDASQPYWFEANMRATDALKERVSPRDYLCLIAGWAQQPIAHAVAGARYNNPITVEFGVGYEGVFTDFCAWESYAWMHHVYGKREIVNGRAYDQVIPNFFDADQFYASPKTKGDYLLFIGRLVSRKGPHIALDIAERVGMPLVVAGYGVTHSAEGLIEYPEGRLEGNLTYAGVANFAQRAELMSNAAAVMVPTLYIEPFGGVAVEAMLSGAPVIASDWGSFTEIVSPDVGRRFRTLAQGAQAVKEVRKLDRKKIRKAAMERYSLEGVGPMFTHWFDQLDGLWGKGWYE